MPVTSGQQPRGPAQCGIDFGQEQRESPCTQGPPGCEEPSVSVGPSWSLACIHLVVGDLGVLSLLSLFFCPLPLLSNASDDLEQGNV